MRLTSGGKLLLFGALAGCSAGAAPGGGAENAGGSSGTSGKGGGNAGGSSGTSGKGGGNVGGSSGTKGGSGGASGSSGASGASGGSGTSGSSGTTGGGIGKRLDCTTPNLGSPTLRLLTRREFDATINDIFPALVGKWTDSLPSNSISASGFDNDSSASVGDQLAGALLDTAVSIGTALTGPDLATLAPCSATTKDHSCAQTFLEQFGLQLFRRALTDADRKRYLTLFDTGLALSDFPTALKWMTVGMIQSPYAVYKSEIGAVANGVRQLDPFELATEIAYTFGGSTPSADLLNAAAAATAQNPLDAKNFAKLLLATDAGKAVMQRFFDAYLGTTGVTSGVKSNFATTFPTLSTNMVEETQHFIATEVLAGDGTLLNLLTSKNTYPSKALATFYGSDPSSPARFPTPKNDYDAVTRPDGQGIGILSQGSFLASHANSDASSPTQRGLFVYYRLLCRPKLNPPATGVPPISMAPQTNTTRERYEQSHAAPGSPCASCHVNFDPIGFGFEAFDEGGRFRTTQGGENIDASGNILDDNGAKVIEFENQEGLAQALADQPETAQCLATYLATYAFGSADDCLGTSQADGLHDGSVKIVDAFAGLADEPHFTQRNAQ